MPLQWVATDMRTGQIIADLPDLTAKGPLKATLGRYEALQVELPIGGVGKAAPPKNWLRATEKGAAVLNALDADTGTPLWGGFVNQRTRGEGDLCALALVTMDGYFDRRYVGTVAYTAADPNFIVADLVNRYCLDGASGKNGIPIRCQYSTGAGTPRTQGFFDYNDLTVYSALTTLMALLGGPEWTVGWEQLTTTTITPVLYVGGTGGSNRVGSTAPIGLTPNAQFSLPGSVITAQLVEDYSSGKGATTVTATSSGQGIARPTSGPYSVTDNTRPTFEYRFSPTQNQLIATSLATHAQQAISVIGGGISAVTITADLTTSPGLNSDWFLGDDIGYQLGGIDQNGLDIVPGFPGGLQGVGRAIGVELTDQATPTISPILLVPEIYTGD